MKNTATIKKIKYGEYQYNLNDKIGSGSFSEVFKGEVVKTKETVAIKCISKKLLEKYGSVLEQAIKNEISILKKIVDLNSPFLLKVFDTFDSPNNIYIVLEYCNGGTALDILKKAKGPLNEALALDIVYQVILGLLALSEVQISHRDLKPDNIFIRNEIFKLGDFGFATQKNLMSTQLGTPPYMAPEFFNSKTYDTAVDIWALGCILHQFLFDENYFMAKTKAGVKNKVLYNEYVIPETPAVSENTKSILRKMIERNPEDRIKILDLKNHAAFAASARKYDQFMRIGFVSHLPINPNSASDSLKDNNQERITQIYTIEESTPTPGNELLIHSNPEKKKVEPKNESISLNTSESKASIQSNNTLPELKENLLPNNKQKDQNNNEVINQNSCWKKLLFCCSQFVQQLFSK